MDALSAIVELCESTGMASQHLRHHPAPKAIQGLIGSIHEGRVKYKDLEFTSKRDLEQARQSLKMLEPQAAPALRAPQEPEITDLMSLAQSSPRAAVIEAWIRLEAAGAEFVQKHAPPDLPKQLRPSVIFGEVLRRQNLIPTEGMKAIQKLRDIRNRTAHSVDFQPSVEDAEEYVVLSMAVIEDLRRIKT